MKCYGPLLEDHQMVVDEVRRFGGRRNEISLVTNSEKTII
jgi:hypothetical protein